MKTTERITRLNDQMWLYEIKTEDPVILTRSFTVRYPMRHDPDLRVVGVRVPRGQHDRAELHEHVAARARETGAFAGTAGCMVDAKNQPTKEPVPADIAKALVGRWVGRPELKTIDYDIIIEFTARPDGGIIGKLFETSCPIRAKCRSTSRSTPREPTARRGASRSTAAG